MPTGTTAGCLLSDKGLSSHALFGLGVGEALRGWGCGDIPAQGVGVGGGHMPWAGLL